MVDGDLNEFNEVSYKYKHKIILSNLISIGWDFAITQDLTFGR